MLSAQNLQLLCPLILSEPGGPFEFLNVIPLVSCLQDPLQLWIQKIEELIRVIRALSPDAFVNIELYQARGLLISLLQTLISASQLPEEYPVSYFLGRTETSIKWELEGALNYDFLQSHAIILPPWSLAEDVKNAVVAICVYYSSDRALSPVSELAERPDTFREAIANTAQKRKKPSDGAKLYEMRLKQNPHHIDAVYTGRPCTLLAPFVGIYHPIFASFTRMMATPPNQLEPRLTHEELDWGTDLVSQSLQFYPNEAGRASGIREVLGRAVGVTMLRPVTLDLPIDRGSRTIIPDGVLQVVPSGHLPITHVLITELENEVGEGGFDPAAQATCDYVAIYTSNDFKILRDISCCPALLVGIAGPRMIVCGAVFTDRPIVQELTDYITLGSCNTTNDYDSGLDRAVYRAAQLLRALREGVSALGVYYQSDIHLAPQSPHFPHFRRFNSGSGMITLEYLERLDLLPRKSVYKARVAKVKTLDIEGTIVNPDLQEGETVIVKFTYRYCQEAHSLLAQQEPRLAPKIWYCEYEPTVDMTVVVMEFVDAYYPDSGPALSQQQFEELQRALRTLHDDGFVFGDLREPNILVPKEDRTCVRLVDFDWSGKEGEVRYPSCIIMDEPGYEWHPGVRRGGLIKKEHDVHLLHLMDVDTVS